MSVENGLEDRERKDLPQDATPKERLKYLKELALFNKAMFGNMTYNDIQDFLDRVIRTCNDSRS